MPRLLHRKIFILLLNSDTYLIDVAISKTVNYYQQNKLNGIIGCKMLYLNGTLQHTARKFRTIKNKDKN